MPDYDGLGMPDAKSDDPGVWLARIVFSPLYLTTEFLIRKPAAALMNAFDGCDCTTRISRVFAWPNYKLGFLPVGYWDTGFFPGVGFFAFWNDALLARNELRLHYEIWPTEWFGGSIADRYRFDRDRWVTLRASATRRPDQVFYGTGPNSVQWHQSRYGISRFDASGAFDAQGWGSSRLHVAAGIRKVDFYSGHLGSDPSLEQEAKAGAFDIPYGFDRGYTGPYGEVRVALDSRKPEQERGSSARIEVDSEQGSDLSRDTPSGWIRYAASASAFIDLNHHERIVSVQLAALFADPLGDQPVPFTELVTLGGDVWMHGYFPGRLVDRSAAVAAIGYRWPIAPKLDATLHAAFGNVFGPHLEGFDPRLLRFSGAFGLDVRMDDPPLQFLVGFGSETFESGGKIDSVRVVIGVPRSF